MDEDGERPSSTLTGQWLRVVVALVASTTLFVAASLAAADARTSVAARELEGRLIAPCCWTQTLDIHDSPVADQLRTEIAKRLQTGESAAVIEDDLAARYGAKIRAVPRGEDPRVALPIIVGGTMGLAVIWLSWLGIVWLRRGRTETARQTQPEAEPRGDETKLYDKQLDRAIQDLSDRS